MVSHIVTQHVRGGRGSGCGAGRGGVEALPDFSGNIFGRIKEGGDLLGCSGVGLVAGDYGGDES